MHTESWKLACFFLYPTLFSTQKCPINTEAQHLTCIWNSITWGLWDDPENAVCPPRTLPLMYLVMVWEPAHNTGEAPLATLCTNQYHGPHLWLLSLASFLLDPRTLSCTICLQLVCFLEVEIGYFFHHPPHRALTLTSGRIWIHCQELPDDILINTVGGVSAFTAD